MKRITDWIVIAAVIACVGLAAIAAFAGGGGTQWFDWFEFEGWPAGVYKEIAELSDEGVSVNIVSGTPGGLFVVGDSGHEEFGQKSLLADKAGILFTFFVPETGRGAREFVFSTRSTDSGTPVVYCWTDPDQVGIRSRTFRVAQGEQTYVNAGYHETSDSRWSACMAVNGAIDQIVVRK